MRAEQCTLRAPPELTVMVPTVTGLSPENVASMSYFPAGTLPGTGWRLPPDTSTTVAGPLTVTLSEPPLETGALDGAWDEDEPPPLEELALLDEELGLVDEDDEPPPLEELALLDEDDELPLELADELPPPLEVGWGFAGIAASMARACSKAMRAASASSEPSSASTSGWSAG